MDAVLTIRKPDEPIDLFMVGRAVWPHVDLLHCRPTGSVLATGTTRV